MARPSPYEVEQQLAATLTEVTDAQEHAILAAWILAWSEVSGDLYDTILDLVADGGRITAATVVRSERLAAALAAIADKLEDLADEVGVTLTRDLDEVVELGISATQALIGAQLPEGSRIDLGRRPPAAALNAMIRRISEQITSTLLPVAEDTYVVIQRELVRGVAAGSSPRETAQRMVNRAEDHWNFGRSRAVNIARTEMLDANREAAELSQNQHVDVLAGWLWLAHLGSRTCRSCLAMHGQLFPLDVKGPKDHQQGRCSRCPVVKDEDGNPDLSWVPSAEEHFENLDKADQVAILGRDGYAAWVAGDFPIEDWTKTRSTDGWRDSQVPAAPGDSGAGSGGGSATPPGGGNDEPRSIGEAINVAADDMQDAVDTVIAAIDRVHLVPGDIETVTIAHIHPIIAARRPDMLGGYTRNPAIGPQLMLRDPSPDDLEFVLTHELGHFLDDLVFGVGDTNLDSGSKVNLDGEFADWWAAVQATDTYARLVRMHEWDPETDGPWSEIKVDGSSEVLEWNPEDKTFTEYLLSSWELLGRSYAQWIAHDSRNTKILAGVMSYVLEVLPDGFTLVDGSRFPRHPLQWPKDEFEAIAVELRRLFEARGLLVKDDDGD